MVTGCEYYPKERTPPIPSPAHPSARGVPSPHPAPFHLLLAHLLLGLPPPVTPILEIPPLVLGEELPDHLVEVLLVLLQRLPQGVHQLRLARPFLLVPLGAGAAHERHRLVNAVAGRAGGGHHRVPGGAVAERLGRVELELV